MTGAAEGVAGVAGSGDTPRGSVGGGATVMALGTGTSRVLGMVKSIVQIAVIGSVSQAANAFTVANTVPTAMYNLLVSGVLSAVLVPQVVRAYKRDAGQEYVDRLLTLGFAALAALTVLLTLAVPLLTLVYADGSAGAQLRLAVAFGYWTMPQVFFYGAYALLGQVLNARGSFGPFTWAPAANNVIAIAGLALFAVMFGAHNDRIWPADRWTSGQIAVLAGGATLGIVAQAAVLLPAMRSTGVRFRPRWGWRGVGLRNAGGVAVWTFLALLIGQAGAIAVSRTGFAAPQAAGARVVAGNQVYQYAFAIFMLPHSLVTVSLVTALFPRLSAQAADRAHATVGATVSLGLRVIGLFTLAAAGIGVVGARPLVRAILPSTRPDAVTLTAQVLIALMVGLPAFGVWSVCQRVYYAYEDARGLVPVAIGMALVVVAGTTATRLLAPPQWWVVGAALSMSASYLLASAMTLLGLRRRIGPFGFTAVLQVHVRALLAALVAALVGWAALTGLAAAGLRAGPGWSGWLVAVAECTVLVGVVAVAYVRLLRALRVRELDLLADSVRRLVRRLRRRRAV